MDADILVVGAGAVGLSAALHAARAGLRVLVLEKEPAPGLHQSGRNSGVIHPGHNLRPGTRKARYCVEGARRLRAYCHERGVAIRENGILVVATDEPGLATVAQLLDRAAKNGVRADFIDGHEVPRIEPAARGLGALHAPDGASFDARGFVHALAADALAAGAEILYDTRLLALDEGPEGVRATTSKGPLTARVAVNAAGLHADRVAAALAPDLRVIPFRGYYAELAPRRRHLVGGHVYGAPDLRFPFLGVHVSRRVDGRVIVGPGAMLALGREAYRFREWDARDLGATLAWPGFWRLLAQPHVRGLVAGEVRKSLSLRAVWREARMLLPELRPQDLVRSYAGNRAQMVDRRGRLVEDIVVRSTDHAVHVLNAVSPGLTCCLPFGEELARQAAARL